MSSDKNYMGILLKEINSQNKTVLEAVGQIQDNMHKLATQSGLQAVADDVATVKAAVTATNHDITQLDSRVTTPGQTA